MSSSGEASGEAPAPVSVREMAPEERYRRGVPRELSEDSLDGVELLVAYVADALSDALSDAALSALGTERLVRLAEELVSRVSEEQRTRLAELMDETGQFAEASRETIAHRVVSEYSRESIRLAAAKRLPFDVVVEDGEIDKAATRRNALEALRRRLDGQAFFRDDEPSSGGNPRNRHIPRRGETDRKRLILRDMRRNTPTGAVNALTRR